MKQPTKRQRELDQAFETAAAAKDWRGDPDEICGEVADRIGVAPDTIRRAVFACQNYDEALTTKLY